MTYEEVVDQINQIRRFGNLAGVEVAGRMLKALGSPQAGDSVDTHSRDERKRFCLCFSLRNFKGGGTSRRDVYLPRTLWTFGNASR